MVFSRQHLNMKKCVDDIRRVDVPSRYAFLTNAMPAGLRQLIRRLLLLPNLLQL